MGNNEPIVMCIKSGQGECCIVSDCSLFQKCFPKACANWQKAVAKAKGKGKGN